MRALLTDMNIHEGNNEMRYNISDVTKWCSVTGLDEISAQLRTVDNYTRLLQTELRTLNHTLTESRQRALSLLQCSQLPPTLRAECNSARREVADARLFLDYLQVGGLHLIMPRTIGLTG